MIGQTFGKLTVINKQRGDNWLCLCSCGNFTVVRGMFLRGKLAKSCKNLKICLTKNTSPRTVHAWMKRNKPKPELCERCKKNPATDLSSDITNKKECGRNFADYVWICRSCRFLKAMRKSKDIYEIRKSYACGTFTQEELAISYGMNMETINQIIQYKGAYSEMK